MGFGSMLGATLGHRAGNAIADGLSGKNKREKADLKLRKEELEQRKRESRSEAEIEAEIEEERAEREAEREEERAERAEREAERNEIASIANLKFGETSADISEELNSLFSKAALLPTGFAAFGDSGVKQKKKLFVEKMEYGILKLNKLDPDNAAFFQKKLDVFTKKKS